MLRIKNIITTTPINTCVPTTNIDEARKPILSKRIPLIEGPIKAPSAKVLVQRPETRPNVSKLFGKPCSLDKKNKVISQDLQVFSSNKKPKTKRSKN